MAAAKLTELKRVDEVPAVLREDFLLTGYRPVGLGVADAVLSVTTRMSNETLNVWTHLLPGIYFLIESTRLLMKATRDGQDSDAIMTSVPLVVLVFGMGMALVTSSAMHCLNCMSPRARHTCFFCDYGAIGFYSVCSGIAHYYYCGPMPSDEPTPTGAWLAASPLFRPSLFVPLLVAVHGGTFLVVCWTRHYWQPLRFVLRTLTYVLAFTVNMVPFWLRLLCSTSPAFAATSLGAFTWQYVWNLLAALSNMSKLPERFFPGRFDTVGHSHQWMHVFVAASLMQEYSAVRTDLEARLHEFTVTPTLATAVATPFVFSLASVFFIIAFRRGLQENGDLKKQVKSS